MPAPSIAPRIAPLAPPYTPETQTLLDKWMPPGNQAEPLRLFRTLAVHDDLASRMRPLGAGILGHGRVAPRDREIIIHRTCARTGAEYEWGVHAVAFGKPLGLSDELLELLIIAGQYRFISYIVNGARVELEPWAARFPT
jgi:4-carboxymuconolactone decarboxylase